MSHELFYFTLWFLVTCWLVWDVKRSNAQMHERSQAIMRDIARFLGTDRR